VPIRICRLATNRRDRGAAITHWSQTADFGTPLEGYVTVGG